MSVTAVQRVFAPRTREDHTISSATLASRYAEVRAHTEALAAPLSGEDQTVQSMPDVSPTKWHRAHTTWFFETFVLPRAVPRYREFDPHYGYLFNSYYEAVGARHPRAERGLVVPAGYRGDRASTGDHVDRRDARRDRLDGLRPARARRARTAPRATAPGTAAHGHQARALDESAAPRVPRAGSRRRATASRHGGREHPGGLVEIGHDGDGFAFDNESPRHRVYLEPYAIADATVSCGDWLAFIDDGGYHRPELWLSDGWAVVQTQQLGSTAVLGTRRRPAGRCSRSRACIPSTRARPSATSATTRPTRSRTGRTAAPPDRSRVGSGRRDRARSAVVVRRRVAVDRVRVPARIRASGPRRARSVSTTASSWSTSTCCAAGAARHRKATSARRTATSSRRAPDGRSAAPDSRTTRSRERLRTQRDPMTDERFSIDVLLPPDHRRAAMAADAEAGLTASPKTLPPVWFYDEHGSELFDEITRLPEYYPTRAERSILTAHAAEIVDRAQADVSGRARVRARPTRPGCSSTRWRTPDRLQRFVPFDVSEETLRHAAADITAAYDIPVHAIVGDFHRHLGAIPRGDRRIVAFLGSTIGNLTPAQRRRFFFDLDATLDYDDWLLLGTDLVKDPARPRRRVRRRGRRHRGVQPQRARRAEPRARRALRPRRVRPRRTLERRPTGGSRCGCDRATSRLVAIDDLALKVPFAPGKRCCTEIAAKFTAEQRARGAVGLRVRRRGGLDRPRRRLPAHRSRIRTAEAAR